MFISTIYIILLTILYGSTLALTILFLIFSITTYITENQIQKYLKDNPNEKDIYYGLYYFDESGFHIEMKENNKK